MTAPETYAERRARRLDEAAEQAMAAARKLSLAIAITDNPQDVIAFNRELARAHRNLRQTELVAEHFERKPAPPCMAPDIRDRETRLRRRRMAGALHVRLDREGLEGPERERLEHEAEAWFATEAVDDAFATDPGAAVMARLVTHLGLEPQNDPPPGVIRFRPTRESSA